MKEETFFGIVLPSAFVITIFGLLLYSLFLWSPVKTRSVIITVNQSGVVKIDGKRVQPDSVKEQHYDYKGQLFDPSVKYYSIKTNKNETSN